MWFCKNFNLILCNDVNNWISQTWASGSKFLSGKTQFNRNIKPGQWTKKNPLTENRDPSDSFIQLLNFCFLLWVQRSRLSLKLMFRTRMGAWVCLLSCKFPYGWPDLAKPFWPLVTSHSLLFKGEIDYMNGKAGSKNKCISALSLGSSCLQRTCFLLCTHATDFVTGRILPVTEDDVFYIPETGIHKPILCQPFPPTASGATELPSCYLPAWHFN